MDYLISTIMGWGPTWAPRSWAICAGQLFAISTYSAVFSLIGTTYGGDGRTTFALPDLRGRAPVGAGQGPGTSHYPQGSKRGDEQKTLTVLEMPSHNHTASTASLVSAISASTTVGDTDEPSDSNVLAKAKVSASGPGPGGDPANIYTDSSNANTTLHGSAVTGDVTIGNTGGSEPISVLQPVQAINFIFCMEGIYPSRS